VRTPIALAACLFAGIAGAGCPEKTSRDPMFVELAVDENAPRPRSVDDFKFIGETTTLDELSKKIGSPNGTKGSRTFVYCLADGTVITVQTGNGTDIRQVRANGKLLYKRK
jgi:hypothetical protein